MRGARLTPQLPVTTVVTPWLTLHAIPGSERTARSSWVWVSMKPGETTSPLASISRAARIRSSRPTAAIRSPATATSAVRRSAPVPSIRVPPRRSSSHLSGFIRLVLQVWVEVRVEVRVRSPVERKRGRSRIRIRIRTRARARVHARFGVRCSTPTPRSDYARERKPGRHTGTIAGTREDLRTPGPASTVAEATQGPARRPSPLRHEETRCLSPARIATTASELREGSRSTGAPFRSPSHPTRRRRSPHASTGGGGCCSHRPTSTPAATRGGTWGSRTRQSRSSHEGEAARSAR